jgi:hypothetical protein
MDEVKKVLMDEQAFIRCRAVWVKEQQDREAAAKLDAEKRAAHDRLAQEGRDQQRAAAAKLEAEQRAAEHAKYEKDTGEDLNVGYFAYQVSESHWSERLSSNKYLNKHADASWLFIKIGVCNGNSEGRLIPPFKLMDESGREYESSSEGMMVENAIGPLDNLNPTLTNWGYVIFDVPKGRKFKLVVSGEMRRSERGYIRLEPKDGN